MDTMPRDWVKEPEILLVEDDPALLESTAEVLEAEGFVVVRAGSAEDALGHLRTSSLPALILLDLMMPGMNGWELYEVLRADRVLGEIPVVALTATATMDRESLHLIDVDDWVAKPSDPEMIISAVRPFFSRSGADGWYAHVVPLAA
jgi:putative two-component system response regulator